MNDWECVVGLEVHIQLATGSKLFSGASTAFGAKPNANACMIDVALPGVLPVCNAEAVRMAVTFGLAIGAKINMQSIFARKNYFYPDLPKGYQISQYEIPIVGHGAIDTVVDGVVRRVGVTRAHLEEDAGKSLHEGFGASSGIDLNRSGTPLLEIVSDPDIRSAAQAADYMRRLHRLVTYLEICDGNMQEGSMRCDANVSVRRRGVEKMGTRTELKNINSFRFVEKGIVCETNRQIGILENGGAIVQETRNYDPVKDITRPMRSKEDAHDYRYFPDPDLPPLVLTKRYVESIRGALPELPAAKKERFARVYGLNDEEADRLTQSKSVAQYFETALSHGAEPKNTANWILVELSSLMNKSSVGIEESLVDADTLGQLVAKIDEGAISRHNGKIILGTIWHNPDRTIDDAIRSQGLEQSADDDQIVELVKRVIDKNPKQVEQYAGGNQKLLGFFVGQTLKLAQGKADPKAVNEIIRRILDEDK